MIGARSLLASLSERLIQPPLQARQVARFFTLIVRRPDALRPGVLVSVKGVPSARSREIHRPNTCSSLTCSRWQKIHCDPALLRATAAILASGGRAAERLPL